jgi:ferredoxin-NADP reductase/cytochrome b involved in lipid metabolism
MLPTPISPQSTPCYTRMRSVCKPHPDNGAENVNTQVIAAAAKSEIHNAQCVVVRDVIKGEVIVLPLPFWGRRFLRYLKLCGKRLNSFDSRDSGATRAMGLSRKKFLSPRGIVNPHNTRTMGATMSDNSVDWERSGPRGPEAVAAAASFERSIVEHLELRTRKRLEDECAAAFDAGSSGWWPLSEAAVAATREPARNRQQGVPILLTMSGEVYDCTRWASQHPGGSSSILRHAGSSDCTEAFQRCPSHGSDAKALLPAMCVGSLYSTAGVASEKNPSEPSAVSPPEVPSANTSDATVAPQSVAAVADKFFVYKTTKLSSNTVRVDIRKMAGHVATASIAEINNSAPSSSSLLIPLECGGHIYVEAPATDAPARPYSPFRVTSEEFSIVVKQYPGGRVCQYIGSLKDGDTFVFRGPERPLWRLAPIATTVSWLVCIAGGTGIAPLYGMAAEACKHKNVKRIFFVSCFQSADQAMLLREVDELVQRRPTTVSSHVFLSRAADVQSAGVGAAMGRAHQVHAGRVSVESLKGMGINGSGLISKPASSTGLAHAVICGPDDFTFSMESALKSLGWDRSEVHVL